MEPMGEPLGVASTGEEGAHVAAPTVSTGTGSRLPALITRPWFGLWRFGRSGGIAEIVPKGGLLGPMPSVVAIMVALTVIAAAAGLALRHVAVAATTQLAGGITVQIVEPQIEARQQQTAASVRVLAAFPGITEVRAVPEAELNALIEPWLGTSTDENDAVPVPGLVDARLPGAVTERQLADIRQALHAVAPAARVDAQSGWLGPVFGAIASLQWLAVALVAMLALAMTATVLLAARTALGTHRETIAIVHMLGGTDRQIARIFQRAVGIDAGAGAVAGFVLALAVVVLLGRRFAEVGAGMVSGGALGWADWLVLALVPLGATLLAMLTARLSARAALRAML